MDFSHLSLTDLSPVYQPQPYPLHAHHCALPIRQPHGSYGVDPTSSTTWQAQTLGGSAVPMQHHALQTFHPALQASHDRFNAGLNDNNQSFSASTAPVVPEMRLPPSKRPRKPKAVTIRSADWEPYKKAILTLHLEQNMPLRKVKQHIEKEYGFKAELRQYRSRISQWGQDKNVKPQEMQAIVRKRQKRKLIETHKRELVFEVRGNEVDRQKIERWMKRHDASDNFLYAPSPAASTPSAVECHTEPGSPMMTTISVYSIPLSPAGAEFTAQRPQMQSTTLSLTGNLRSPTDNFPEQSSVLEPQCFPSLQLSFIYSLSDPDSVMNRSVHTSYKKDEEERLLTGLVIADLAIPGNPWEILRMLSDLGEVLLQQGRWKTAADVASRLVEGHKSRLASSSDDAEMLAALAVLGRARSHQGLLAEAERLFRRVIIGSSVNAHNDPCRILHLCLLAATVREQNKIEEAESVCRQAMEEAEKSHGLKHRFTLFTARFFSSLLQEQGRYEETEVILNKTLKLLKEVFGLEDAATLHCTDILAEVLSCQEKYKEAEEMQREVVAVAKKVFGPESSKTLEFMSRLSSGLAKQGRYEESEVVRRETLVLQKRFYGYEDTTTMLSLSRLGDLLEKQGKLEEAEAVFTETLALGRNLLGHKHPWTLSNIPRLRQVLECQGKFEESDSVQ